jgi:hypothetical protein
MRALNSTAVVTADHILTMPVPSDVLPGTHDVVLVIKDPAPSLAPSLADWPVHAVGLTDTTTTFRREDLYGDDGR